MSLWICGICKKTLEKGEDPMAHLDVCKPKRIAELEAENKRLRKQVDELIKQKRQLEADLRQL